MRRLTAACLAAALAATASGCSVQSVPEQPKLTDQQIQDLMKQGAQQRERSDPRGGMGPTKPKPK